jgi:hypothetical protein
MKNCWIVQSFDGSILGKTGWSDFISEAVFFLTRPEALAASQRHVGSRVVEVEVASEYFQQNLIQDRDFVRV